MFTAHARRRMAQRGILESDALAVLQNPDKRAPGDDGATNFWGYGPSSGYRIRVTQAADGNIKTVAWADHRKQGQL